MPDRNPTGAVAAIRSLGKTVSQILDVTADLDDHAYRWKPATDRWSIVEVLGHLVDEEREDFRVRLAMVLENSPKSWPPIDPVGWATARSYNTRDPAAVRAAFRTERDRSLEWLAGLADAPWDNRHPHPRLGPLRAGDLLAAWAAHDLLHLRQVVNLRIGILQDETSPFSTAYAG
jgi:uncharacterized damage-inducible protein DinB